jgi:hypothetical protein
MNDLKELETILDTMISKQKEKKARTFVAKYKGKNLVMRSGKSSWRQIGHAKLAVLNHFEPQEHLYKYYPNGKRNEDGKVNPFVSQGSEEREKEFRAKLFELIEIVELTD